MRERLAWAGTGIVACAATSWAMYREVTTFGKPESIQTGLDFSNNTWRAVRDLLSGVNIYAPTHQVIPGIGPAWPVSQHVPASLLWQAPVAALPLPAALFTFTFASILAIWAAVFVLTKPAQPDAVFLAACCGAFAICCAGGPVTLLLGQPTGFALLGVAIVVRAERPWVAGIGFLLAASTLQTGIPLALVLLVLRRWPVLWRGVTLTLACSLPVMVLEIANAGLGGFVTSFVTGASVHLDRLSNRIDLGALLDRLGVQDKAVQVAAGLLVLAVALAFLSKLPAHLRRIDYPPVFCLVICVTITCLYHQPYDMLLIGGGIVPLILVVDQSRAMMATFAAAGISAGLSSYQFALVPEAFGVLITAVFSAIAAGRAAPALSSGGADISGDGLDRHPGEVPVR
jgi:Glycosyltransferase family 87